MAIGVALLAVGAIVGVALLINYVYQYIKHKKKKKKAQKEFLDYLKKNYLLPNNIDTLDVEEAISSIISHVLSLMICDKRALSSFQNLYSEFSNNYTISSSTISTIDLVRNLSSIKGKKFKLNNEGWPNAKANFQCFSLIWKYGAIYFYPFFCIVEKDENIKIVEWKDVRVTSTKGDPAYYTYLHTRVDGGPDRRYSYNPSIAVYMHSALTLDFKGNSIHFIFSDENAAEIFEKKFQGFKKMLSSSGGVTIQPNIHNCDVRFDTNNDEYITAFKRVIEERGKQIVMDRLFISILADYRVFKEKPFLRPFLLTMQEEGYWHDLLRENPTSEQLNEIKKKFIIMHQYPKSEVNEALEYIKYGLGVTV